MGIITSISEHLQQNEDNQVDRVRVLVNLINSEFKITTSAYDPSKYNIQAHKPELYPYGVTLDTVYWYMKGIGSPISKTDLRTMVREPNLFPPTDPIRSYFDSIRNTYKGESHIDLFCSHLQARVFDTNKTEGYYQKRVNTLVRKWMVACVAQWLADKPNDIALGFISANERIGKTYATQFLLPDSLSHYYVKTEDNDKFYLGDFFTRYMMLCFDELVGINRSKGRVEEFKKYMRDSHILVQRRYEDVPTPKRRLACALFTSNLVAEMGGFLEDNFGYSRFAPIELDHIDKKYSEICDKNQMWAEALLLFENTNFSSQFDDDDIRELLEYNERYYKQSDETKYVILYAKEPSSEELDEEYMSASEFITRLKKERKIAFKDVGRISEHAMGYALKKAFGDKIQKRKKGETSPRYRYHFSINI